MVLTLELLGKEQMSGEFTHCTLHCVKRVLWTDSKVALWERTRLYIINGPSVAYQWSSQGDDAAVWDLELTLSVGMSMEKQGH